MNNVLMLIKLDSDTMAFTSLLVSIVGALAAICAAFYANIAAYYAKKAATRRDLTRVEQDTQHVERFSNNVLSIDTQIQPQAQREASHPEPQQEIRRPQARRETPHPEPQQEIRQPQARQETSVPQPQQEAPQLQAQRISISVEGEAMGDVPLEIFLTLQDSSNRVSRVETLNGARKPLSSSPSKATDKALVFKSILTPKQAIQWWNAQESTSEGGGGGVLRVYLSDESRREVYRDIPVSMLEELRSVGITSLIVRTIKGSI